MPKKLNNNGSIYILKLEFYLNSWMGLMIALKATTADCFLRVIAGAPVTEFE
jgi:hypothetical protein